jgi:poly(3-hydroxybutyrate) depolymerase
MRSLAGALPVLAPLFLAFVSAAPASAQRPFDGLSCENPDLNYDLGEYPSALVRHTGNATEPASGRPFFLDFPCGLQPGDEVTFVLNLHGGGSLGNWQRHYFPIFRYKDEYNLVIATPDAGEAGAGTWNPEVDDAYLRGVVDYVYELFADQDVTFWFAGHSFGGFTTRRLICTDFYQARNPVGFVSLSGGRVGSPRPGRNGDIAPLPECDFSHIFTSGQHEVAGGNLASTSRWAEKYHCGARQRQLDVIDTRPGYLYDSSRQDPGTASWGLLPRPGTAEWYVYPDCDGGRVVADLIRIDKGHTEGLEENVVEQIVQLMMSVGR